MALVARLRLFATVVVILLTALPDASAAAKFEALSIKLSAPDQRGYTLRLAPGERVAIEAATVKDLIALAYGVRDFQISGAPSWADSERYELVGKAEAGYGDVTMAKLAPLLKDALADRFALKLHREKKDMVHYRLVIAKGGSRLKANMGAPGPEGRSGAGRMSYRKISVAVLVSQLAEATGRPVIDGTGLQGDYDVEMTWTPDGALPAADAPAGPTIFTALEEQLGLKLESEKGPVEILVVDNVNLAVGELTLGGRLRGPSRLTPIHQRGSALADFLKRRFKATKLPGA